VSQRATVKHCQAPAGTPAGVLVSVDDALQITLMISDDRGEAMEVALSTCQAASVGWHLLSLAEPRGVTALITHQNTV
jgi:hypothetical protein